MAILENGPLERRLVAAGSGASILMDSGASDGFVTDDCPAASSWPDRSLGGWDAECGASGTENTFTNNESLTNSRVQDDPPATPQGPGDPGESRPPAGADPTAADLLIGVGSGEPPLDKVVVIGAGLIGTSIALALRRRGVDVAVDDIDDSTIARSLARGAGRIVVPGESFDHAVICVPPTATALVIKGVQDRQLAMTMSDVAGFKTKVLHDAETLGCDMSKIVGGHPFAGRERGGPENADKELFTDRPWVLCPTAGTSADALLAARRLAEGCGAVTVVISAEDHDAAAARLSHLPQLLASALASSAAALDGRSLSLAGQGFRDLTRIAESPAGLWREVIAGNAHEVAAALRELLAELEPLQEALGESLAQASEADVGEAVQALVTAGNEGRRRLPIKPGRPITSAATVVVAVSDRAGELARLLADAAAVGVNVEDVHVQHGAAAARGLVDLDIAAVDVGVLLGALRGHGWRCWSP